MITKYQTEVQYPKALIVPVEVLRETEHCVFIPFAKTKRYPSGERKESKVTDWHEYHDTWDLAHKSLTAKAEQSLIDAQNALERARAFADEVKAMQDPAANGNAGRISGDT